MKYTKHLLVAVTIVAAVAAHAAEHEAAPVALFDGKSLDGWVVYPADAETGGTWTVADGIIKCTGKPSGYIRTEEMYEDYRLHIEWRWAGKPGNSGLLMHMSEPDKVWPKSIESQLMNGNAGDFWLIDGTMIAEHGGRGGRRVPKMEESSEKPAGEWNVKDVICLEDRIEVRVNGTLQNVGTEATVDEGHICLQSEGAPIEFRNITLVPLDDEDDDEEEDEDHDEDDEDHDEDGD